MKDNDLIFEAYQKPRHKNFGRFVKAGYVKDFVRVFADFVIDVEQPEAKVVYINMHIPGIEPEYTIEKIDDWLEDRDAIVWTSPGQDPNA